jgi:hypothetical protein
MTLWRQILLVTLILIAKWGVSQDVSVDNLGGKEWYCLKSSCITLPKKLPGDGAFSPYVFHVTLKKDKTYFMQSSNADTGHSGKFSLEKGTLKFLNAAGSTTSYHVEFWHGNFLCLKMKNCYYYLVAKS